MDDLVLVFKVGEQAMVHQSNDRLSLCLRSLNLIHSPHHEILVQPSSGDVLIGLHTGGIGAVHPRVHSQNDIVPVSHSVGQATRLLALGRGVVLGVEIPVITEVGVKFLKFIGGNGLGTLLFPVFKGAGIGVVVHVVVAVDDKHVNACLILQGLELGCDIPMALLFAVLGQVTGDEYNVRPVLLNDIHCRIKNGAGLRQHLGVAVDVGGIVLAVADVVEGIVVGVRHDTDFQLLTCWLRLGHGDQSQSQGTRQT